MQTNEIMDRSELFGQQNYERNIVSFNILKMNLSPEFLSPTNLTGSI